LLHRIRAVPHPVIRVLEEARHLLRHRRGGDPDVLPRPAELPRPPPGLAQHPPVTPPQAADREERQTRPPPTRPHDRLPARGLLPRVQLGPRRDVPWDEFSFLLRVKRRGSVSERAVHASSRLDWGSRPGWLP